MKSSRLVVSLCPTHANRRHHLVALFAGVGNDSDRPNPQALPPAREAIVSGQHTDTRTHALQEKQVTTTLNFAHFTTEGLFKG